MPSYKLEIRKQYGTFHAKFGPAPEPGAEKKFDALGEVLDFVRKEAARLDLEDDPVIFRGIAYSSVNDLLGQVRGGSY